MAPTRRSSTWAQIEKPQNLQPHRALALHLAHAAHVTLRVAIGVPSLRCSEPVAIVRDCIRAAQRDDFRIIELHTLATHIHLLTEADSSAALTEGMHSLNVRLAHRLNRCFGRRGALFAERHGILNARVGLRTRCAARKKGTMVASHCGGRAGSALAKAPRGACPRRRCARARRPARGMTATVTATATATVSATDTATDTDTATATATVSATVAPFAGVALR